MEIPIWKILFFTFVVLVVGFCLQIYVSLVIKPKRIRNILRQQGVNGPPPTLLLGNIPIMKRAQDAARKATVDQPHPPVIHNTAAAFPFLEQWRQQYGPPYMFFLGNIPTLYMSSPEMVKQITTCTSSDLRRPTCLQKELDPLLGQGIAASNGTLWARQRKIMVPDLFMDNVKGMMDIITVSALTMVNSWKNKVRVEEGEIVDITVDDYMKRFLGDVIYRACFGSSYSKGHEIFVKFDALQELMFEKTISLRIHGLRHIPTKRNRQIWALEKEITGLILKVVRERKQAGYKKDLLHILMEGTKSSYSSSDEIDQFIVDNCRNIYLAGSETSAISASWCLMLLASNPEWQTRVRNEVEEVCQGRPVDKDMLPKMKQLNMVIQAPVPLVPREALKDMKVGGILVPKGVNLWTMVRPLHTDTAIWGPDALEFKPQRFENGITGACKNPNSYVPFGFGQHICIGQHLTMVELKVLMALILTNFSFPLSPNYVHSPVMRMTVHPKHGVNILIKKL